MFDFIGVWLSTSLIVWMMLFVSFIIPLVFLRAFKFNVWRGLTVASLIVGLLLTLIYN